jgi:hypothetical protein
VTPQTQGRWRRHALWIALTAVWLAAAGAALAWLMQYDNTPGEAAHAPLQWPADSAMARDPQGPTLVMLAHPRCDCTRASLTELAELLARAPKRPRTYVVFIKPTGVDADWERSGVWRQASDIEGAEVLRDDGGLEARRFGVSTSGQTLLYSASGALVYAGGTTGARAKAGNNAGRTSLVALLNGQQPGQVATPVFGCSLFGPGDSAPHAEAHTHGS